MITQISYPPYIEGIIPAFYGDILKIPYTKNPAVGDGEYKGFVVQIKNAYSGNIITTVSTLKINDEEGQDVAIFTLTGINSLIPGQYYKVQLAYLDNFGNTGIYSTVGIVKYSAPGSATIKGYDANSTNLKGNEFIGEYSPSEEDLTEKQYSYIFNIYDSNYNLIETSGEMLHNIEIGYDQYITNCNFEPNSLYFINYKVITLNKMEVNSRYYKIVEQNLIDGDYDFKLKAELNYENAYVNLFLSTADSFNSTSNTISVTGNFVLSRSSRKNNFCDWKEITRFSLVNATIDNQLIFKDFTIEQGETYKYNIQQYNRYNVYSKKTESNEIFGDFEHLFLYDGEKQLKIKFNPKIQNFKDVVLAQKTDTIGGKYPTIFRNGIVKYKEFGLSGLISFLMDEENLFFNQDEYLIDPDINSYITTDLTSHNIYNERQFKLQVMDWLNNGKPKLLKTAAEGNYIVQLMNIALTPNDTVGRMLHNFSSTAYEMDDLNWMNLKKYGFIRIENPVQYSLQWKTKSLDNYDFSENNISRDIINHKTALNVRIETIPGAKFALEVEGENIEIIIGRTGIYEAYMPNGITSIKCISPYKIAGLITYSYYDIVENKFDKIATLNLQEILETSIYGRYMTQQEIKTGTYEFSVAPDLKIIENTIEDVKTIFSKWTRISFKKRNEIVLTYNPLTKIVNGTNINDEALYNTVTKDCVFYTDPNLYTYTESNVKNYYEKIYVKVKGEDKVSSQFLQIQNNNFNTVIELNSDPNNTIRLSDAINEEFVIPNPEDIKEIKIGPGVIAYVGYYYLTLNYNIEEEIKNNFTSKENTNNYSVNPTINTYLQDKETYKKLIKKLDEQGVSIYEESYG